MPLHDFICDPEEDGCGHKLEDHVLTFEEFDRFKADGQPCPECGRTMLQVFGTFRFHFPTRMTDSGPVPGSKRGRAKLMEERYRKRNERLESLPPEQKSRMESFFSRRGVRRTPPSEPTGR